MSVTIRTVAGMAAAVQKPAMTPATCVSRLVPGQLRIASVTLGTVDEPSPPGPLDAVGPLDAGPGVPGGPGAAGAAGTAGAAGAPGAAGERLAADQVPRPGTALASLLADPRMPIWIRRVMLAAAVGTVAGV